MEVIKINKIITALGDPIIYNNLKKSKEINILNKDIIYQEGIIEFLEINEKIDYLILNQLLPGEFDINELIEKIQEKNNKIKIIIILKKYNEEIKNTLIKKGVFRVLTDDEIKVENIIKIINEDKKMEKYYEEIEKEINEIKKYNSIKNNNKVNENNNKKYVSNKLVIYKKNKLNVFKKYFKKIKIINRNLKDKIKKIKNLKNNNLENYINNISEKQKNIITILGTNCSGKSVFSVIFSMYMKKYYNKILIINFNYINNSIDYIKKNNKENNLIYKINKNIYMFSDIYFFVENNKINIEKIKNEINKLLLNYDLIIIDTSSENAIEINKELINLSNKCFFLTEANLLEVSKSKKILEKYINKWKINSKKIKIIFNKYNIFSINKILLKNIYSDFNIAGYIKYDKKINYYININFKGFIINKYYKNKIKKIFFKERRK